MATKPNVQTFTATNTQGQPVRFTVSTDIVDYMDSAKTFGRDDMADPTTHGRFQRRMIALPDRKAQPVKPMVLTMGSNNELYLVQHSDSAHGGGWQLNDLTPSLQKVIGSSGNLHVRSIGAAWNDDDQISLAVAVDDGTVNAPSRLLVAFNLGSKTTNWEQIPWQDCGSRAPVRVEGIRVLENDDGTWTVVLAADRNNVDTLYLLRSDMLPSFARALVFNPAVDYQEVLDFEVAVDPFIDSGIAILGISGGVRVLSFRPFPQYNSSGRAIITPPVVPLPCPPGANVLEAGPTRNGGSDLYIGGNGIHLLIADEFDNQDSAKLVEIADATAASDVQDLVIDDTADGSTAVWALLSNGGLLVVKRPAGKNAAWTTPLRLRNDIQAMAPVCGDNHTTTSLLAIYDDGRAAFIWQDAKTTVWNESPLLVANPGSVSKVSCYGTSLRYLDSDGVPQPDKLVKVSASLLASVVLNGRTVFIGPDLAVEAKTDANGSINLYDPVRSLTPAIYRFTLDELSDSVDVNPAAGAHQRFREIKADELRNATVAKDGGGSEALLDAEFAAGGKNASQVDGMVAALNHASNLAVSTAGSVAPGITTTQRGSAFSSSLKNSSLPRDFKVGIKATASGVQSLDDKTVTALVNSKNNVEKFFSDLGDTIVDFFEGLAQKIREGWEFVLHRLEDGFRFICKIGDKIKHFVLDTLEQVGSFFSWLWKQVKTGLEKVWNFLKFLFEWDDVLLARSMMVKATDEALTYLQNSTDTLKEKVNTGFDHAIQAIRQWESELGIPAAVLPPPAPGTSISDKLQSFSADQMSLHDQITGNSIIGWVMQKLGSVLDEIIHIEGADPSEVAIKTATDFISGLMGDELDNLVRTWEQIKADVLNIFGKQLPSKDRLSFDTIKDVIIAVGADIVVGLLDGLRSLVLRALDLLVGMLDVVRAALFAKISFPFIEKLVELVVPGKHIDTSFRLVDGIMLLLAIPSTIAYKLIFNEAPFKKGDVLTLPFGRVSVQSSGLDSFRPFAATVSGFLKLAMAGFLTYKAIQAEAAGMTGAVNKPAIIFGLALGGIGLATEIFVRHDANKEKDGGAIEALEWGAIGTVGFCLVCSAAFATAKWNASSGSAKADAVITIIGTIAQIGLGTAVFGILIDALRQAKSDHDQFRQEPESFRWIGRLLDQIGTIVFAAAIIDSEPTTKTELAIGGAGLKAAGLVCAIGQVTSQKLVVDKV